MKKPKLTITYDFTSSLNMSYFEAKDAISKRQDVITCCLSFFRLMYTNDNYGYDVLIIKRNGDYISANELLIDSSPYCDREIRMAHDIEKMFRAGAFKWRNGCD